MAQQRPARREDPLADRRLPVGVGARRVDLADDDVEHAVEHLLLVGEVLVERHRDDAELLREPAHAERVDAVPVGERDGGGQDPLPAQGLARRGLEVGFGLHPSAIDKCTPYTLGSVRVGVRRTPRQEGDDDEGDRAGQVRLGGRARAPRRRGPGGRRGRRPRAGAGGRLRPRRVAHHDRQAVLRSAHAGVQEDERRRARQRCRRPCRGRRRERDGPAARRRGDGRSSRARSPSSRSARTETLVRKPANISVRAGGGRRRSPGCTAVQALRDVAAVQPGQTVLVIGAAGGVGTLAVQIAKASGAKVTGVCSGPKADLVRSLGADDVIDYTSEDFTDGSRRWDVIVDGAGRRPLRHLRRALDAEGDARDRGRRRRWQLDRRLLPPDPASAAPVALHRSAHAPGHLEGEPSGPRDAARS